MILGQSIYTVGHKCELERSLAHGSDPKLDISWQENFKSLHKKNGRKKKKTKTEDFFAVLLWWWFVCFVLFCLGWKIHELGTERSDTEYDL